MPETQFLFINAFRLILLHTHIMHDLMYTACGLNLLYLFLENNLSLFYLKAHTGRASANLPLLAYHL